MLQDLRVKYQRLSGDHQVHNGDHQQEADQFHRTVPIQTELKQ